VAAGRRMGSFTAHSTVLFCCCKGFLLDIHKSLSGDHDFGSRLAFLAKE